MPTLANIMALLESLAPPHWAAEWDNVGLQVGDPRVEVSQVALAVDVTPEIIATAAEAGAELVVAHHPLLFRPLQAIVTGSPVGDGLTELIRRRIALYVAHTNLDRAPQYGTAAALAQLLGLQDVTDGSGRAVDATTEAGETALAGEVTSGGYARLGRLPGAERLGDWAATVGQRLGVAAVQVAGDPAQEVQRVAVAPGAGGGAVGEVAGQCEVLVTGELSHHEVLEALHRGLAVIMAGHAATEAPVWPALQALLWQTWPQLQVTVVPPAKLTTVVETT
jgi:dinuclear metal center YbgI/SA1388 family protein